MLSIIIILAFFAHNSQQYLQPTCSSKLFCQGDLLDEVQMQELYRDGKTFVDMAVLNDENEIVSSFAALKQKYGGKRLPLDVLDAFVAKNFMNCTTENNCTELIQWNPPDFTENPPIIDKIHEKRYKEWALELNKLWKTLGRHMTKTNSHSSLIYVPNGFIVPGGRFQELYYWDTFWIVKGLLICNMPVAAKGIIQNMFEFLKTIGHIPNGSRVYYTQRTQPPLVTQMMEAYLDYTGDKDFILSSLQLLDKEMNYFLSNRRVVVEVNGKKHEMFHYFAPSAGPRPESYREDSLIAEPLKSPEEKARLFINLKSAAESGWDFSSRWIIKNGTNQGTLVDTKTEYIIPVDLNSLMHKNFVLMCNWYKKYGKNDKKAAGYEKLAKDLLIAIEEVLWNEKSGIWFDYDTLNGKQREYFYASNFSPLWTQSYTFNREKLSSKILRYVNENALFRYTGGTPTSLDYTNEQWDYPNAWPPLQAFIIQGLDRLRTEKAGIVAAHLADTWLESNYAGFYEYKKMFEKYDSTSFGRSGSGGEYEGQAGFGWTNGLAFEFLQRWKIKRSRKQ